MLHRAILCLAMLVLGVLSARAQSTDWKLLFHSKDMTGWEHVGPGGFEVEEGLLKPHGGMGLWLARKLWDHVDLLPGPAGLTVRLNTRLR